MLTAFEKLIDSVPRSSGVLDIGYGGLDGENTTDFLRKRFIDVTGICKDERAVIAYQERTKARDTVWIGMYPEDVPAEKFDLLVVDSNIESNLNFWSEEGMRTASQFLYGTGYLITYILATENYGEEDTPKKIAAHRDSWWGTADWDTAVIQNKLENLPGYTFIKMEREERRPEILWVLLQRG